MQTVEVNRYERHWYFETTERRKKDDQFVHETLCIFPLEFLGGLEEPFNFYTEPK